MAPDDTSPSVQVFGSKFRSAQYRAANHLIEGQGGDDMASTQLGFAVACGVIAVLYGLWSRSWILQQNPGNGRMQ
jgi:hypothetical protein